MSAQEALAAGVQLRSLGYIAILNDHDAVLDEHERGCADLPGVGGRFVGSLCIPAGGGGAGVSPVLAGKDGWLLC